MARSFLRRRSRGASSARRKFGWTSVIVSQTTNGAVQKQVLCDVGSYFGSASNAKHAGTLTRIRGNLNLFDDGASGDSFGIGIVMNDVGEVAADFSSPQVAAFGEDEDVLFWWVGRATSGGGGNLNLPVDIRVKRRMDVEAEISIIMLSATSNIVFGNLRCLVQLV